VNVPASQFIDGGLTPGTTYVYYVASGSTSPSNFDLATTMNFTPIQSGMPVTAAPFNELLGALNAMRAAAGWSQVTWANILGPGDPLPSPGEIIPTKHLLALRARMNEAAQALGVSILGYTDADLSASMIRAQHLRDLQDRAK
jgi:hypothetical protein